MGYLISDCSSEVMILSFKGLLYSVPCLICKKEKNKRKKKKMKLKILKIK